MNVNELIGKTFTSVVQNDNDEITFTELGGKQYRMFHNQDCCESVGIEDVCGTLADLVGVPILEAEESTNQDAPKNAGQSYPDDCFLWTFYKFGTAKGRVTIRWYGTSNGYYSESVDLEEV